MKNTARLVGLMAATWVVGTACGAGPPSEMPAKNQDMEARAAARTRAVKPLPEAVPATPAAAQAAATGEVPQELLARIREDLAKHTSAEPAAFEVIRAESVTWNDGSLGCSRPGEYYTQAQVPGYRVLLSHEGRQYDYRASSRGHFMLCTSPTPFRPRGNLRSQ